VAIERLKQIWILMKQKIIRLQWQ